MGMERRGNASIHYYVTYVKHCQSHVFLSLFGHAMTLPLMLSHIFEVCGRRILVFSQIFLSVFLDRRGAIFLEFSRMHFRQRSWIERVPFRSSTEASFPPCFSHAAVLCVCSGFNNTSRAGSVGYANRQHEDAVDQREK